MTSIHYALAAFGYVRRRRLPHGAYQLAYVECHDGTCWRCRDWVLRTALDLREDGRR